VQFLPNFLRPAPPIPEIDDAEVIEKEYPYWRVRTLYSIFFGYAFYYLTRKSYTYAMPGLMLDLGYDTAQLGFLGTILSITYGFSKFTSGMISDCSSPRYFMALGLICSGITNICFGLSSSLLFFSIFWGLNGCFQAFGAPPCVRFLTQWYSNSERGSWWSSWSISHNVGSFMIPWIAGWCLYYFGGWRYAMFIPGVMAIMGGLILLNRLRDTPASIGLPPIEKYRNEPQSEEAESSSGGQGNTAVSLVSCVVRNPYIWLLALSYFFIYIVRVGVGDWTAMMLWKSKGYSNIAANGSISLFDLGGLLGGLSAGWGSDRLFGGRRGPVNCLFAVGIVGMLCVFSFIPEGYAMLDSAAIFVLGFFVYGPQMLIGVAAAELVGKRAAATSNGFVGLTAYMGAAVAGYPLGLVIREFGWDGFFLFLTFCAAISVLLLMPLWGVGRRKEVALPAAS
jgi:OPA family sugar phosphate sensor protein UhpC-like MFS transporter